MWRVGSELRAATTSEHRKAEGVSTPNTTQVYHEILTVALGDCFKTQLSHISSEFMSSIPSFQNSWFLLVQVCPSLLR